MLCCYYDTWRRMEQIRLAKAHVQRKGYHKKLDLICNASVEHVEAAIAAVGEGGNIRDVMKSSECPVGLKEAFFDLMVFTSEVIGSDGARARLRYEQNGLGLEFGPAGGFLTPNMADVRSPLVVVLPGGGTDERYEINLLEDCPKMPSAREMLQIVA